MKKKRKTQLLRRKRNEEILLHETKKMFVCLFSFQFSFILVLPKIQTTYRTIPIILYESMKKMMP